MAQLAIRLVSGAFALGLQLAAPFIVFGFAVSAAIGLLARLMPQMQVFFIAMPINILAGFFLHDAADRLDDDGVPQLLRDRNGALHGLMERIMADETDDAEQTEDPTPRRLEEAAKHGDIVKSQEVSTFVLLGAGTLAIALFGHSERRDLRARLPRPARTARPVLADAPAAPWR